MNEKKFTKDKNFDVFQLASITPQVATATFLKFWQGAIENPKKIESAQKEFCNKILEFNKQFIKSITNSKKNESIDLKYNSEKGCYDDKTFDSNPMIMFINQYYETVSKWMVSSIEAFDNVDQDLKQRTQFFLNQYLEMMSPSNFPMFNSEFLKTTMETNGANIIKGIELMRKDILNGAISTTDKSAFDIGVNIASTPGKVIFQNDIMELIQYSSSTDTVFIKPMLIIPPWINKFYILDLTKDTSFVKWAIDNGFTVFMISWVNPDARHSEKGFESYAKEGLIEALNMMHKVTKQSAAHVIGYCVGGTLISSLLAYLENPKSKIKPLMNIESATLLTTLLDFSKAGDLAIFMADTFLNAIDTCLEKHGYLDGQIMFNTFSTLKSKDMIWRYVINSYMLGKTPPAHDILFWNADPANITKAMQKFLSKDLYRDNLLKTGTLKMMDVAIDLTKIKTPIYMISMQKDHLVPWKATYDSLKLLNKNVRFVLGGSGHVAGVVNPPAKNKYCFWINDHYEDTPEKWLESATKKAGSWWIDWLEWIKPMMGEKIASPIIEESIYDAPGKYVKS